MLAEHRTIRNLHGQFHRYLEQLAQGTQSESGVVEAFEPLEDVLRTHITKEDNVLFPLASRVMSDEDRNEVARLVTLAKV
jgi:hemerythrin-like domain-containing protein